MNSTPRYQDREAQAVHPGVYANPHGGYIVHVRANDRVSPVLSGAARTDDLAPADTSTLAGMTVFEDCVAVALQDGHTILLHASDLQVKGSVLRFYHADGSLWRVVALEQLNPGWVSGRTCFGATCGSSSGGWLAFAATWRGLPDVVTPPCGLPAGG